MKNILLTVAILLIALNTFSQTATGVPSIESPNTASLGVFGEIPVNLFTGTPDISVPIYTVKSGSISFPIVLKYHPALVKPNEHPGWTGLGWNLQCGGSIYRTIKGFVDEEDQINFGAYYPNGRYTSGAEKVNVSDWDTSDRLRTHFSISNGNLYDAQADEFSFNFLSYSGKFFYTSDGWKVVSDQNIKIEVNGFISYLDIENEITSHYFSPNPQISQQSRMFMGFTLTTEDGTKYIFGNTNANDIDAIEFAANYTNQQGLWACAWQLKKIIDKNSNEITFSYHKNYPICKLSFFSTSTSYNCYYDWSSYSGYTSNYINTAYHGGQLIIPVYLTDITALNQKVVFSTSISSELNYSELFLRYEFDNDGNPNSDLDLTNPANGNRLKLILNNIDNIKWERLNTITIQDFNLNPTKSFNFTYNNPSNKRLCLYSLEEKDVQAITGKKYIFQYNDINALPEYGGNYTDHWGYFNNVNIDGHSYSNLTNDRNTNTTFVKKGLLTQINYPTGGYTTFDWEAHDYSKVVSTTRVSLDNAPTPSFAGGCRISEIKSYASSTSNPIEKSYYYVKNFTNSASGLFSSGTLNGLPQYTFNITNRPCTFDTQNTISYNINSVNSLVSYSFNSSGSPIGYSEVIEKNGDGSYTKFLYTNFDTDINGNSHFDDGSGVIGWLTNGEDRYIQKSEKDLERGKIVRISKYNTSNQTVDDTRYYYRTDPSRLNQYIKRCDLRNSFACEAYDAVILAAAFKEYTYNYYIEKEERTRYDVNGQNPITSTENYIYNLHNHLATKNQTQSDGSTQYIYYKYPYDFTTSPYSLMVTKNIMTPLVEMTTTKGTCSEVIKTNYYNPSGSIYVPQTVQQTVGTSTNTRMTYNSYDDKGNVTQYTGADGLVVTLIWAYNKTYPVAKIVSSIAITISDALRNAINNRAYCGTDVKSSVDADILFLSGELSTYITNDSYQVTLFTFKPLVGMTSQTQPNGKTTSDSGTTTYYSYDTFGRLSEVKDDDGKLLKRHKYRYATN